MRCNKILLLTIICSMISCVLICFDHFFLRKEEQDDDKDMKDEADDDDDDDDDGENGEADDDAEPEGSDRGKQNDKVDMQNLLHKWQSSFESKLRQPSRNLVVKDLVLSFDDTTVYGSRSAVLKALMVSVT